MNEKHSAKEELLQEEQHVSAPSHRKGQDTIQTLLREAGISFKEVTITLQEKEQCEGRCSTPEEQHRPHVIKQASSTGNTIAYGV